SATGDLWFRTQRPLSRRAAGTANDFAESLDRPAVAGKGRRLGRMPFGTRHARRRASLYAYPLYRIRSLRIEDRARRRRVSRPRRAARSRSPARPSVSVADRGLLEVRVYRRAVSGPGEHCRRLKHTAFQKRLRDVERDGAVV